MTTVKGQMMGDYEIEATGTIPPVVPVPTQTRFPAKAVIRTVVAYLVGLAIVVLVREVPAVESLLYQLQGPMVDALTNATIVALSGFITWLMSRPKINAFLTKLGLGAQPAKEVLMIEGGDK